MAGFTKTSVNSITGTAVDDIILVTLGAHAETGTISGGLGKDILRFSSAVAGDLLFIGANITGIETVQIGGGLAATPTTTTTALDIDASAAGNALSLTGNAGDNMILGSAFGDFFFTSAGADALYGGGGNDTFTIKGGYNADTVIDGEDGIDTLAILVAGLVALNPATDVERVLVQISNGGVDASAVFNGAGLEIFGSVDRNHIIGTDADDIISGGAGRDRLEGGAGNDVFLIGKGSDFVVMQFTAVSEEIFGGDGVDEVRFTSTTAGDTLELLGISPVEVERVVIADAAGLTTGTTALNINARFVDQPLIIVGNDGANRIRGTGEADTIIGNGGDDVITFFAGEHGPAEIIDGGAGFDVIETPFAPTGSFGTVVLSSAVDVERVAVVPLRAGEAAGAGRIDAHALLVGTELWGNAGADSIIGGSGADTLRGGKGRDTLLGGAGDDAFEYVEPAETTGDVVDGGSGTDRLLLSVRPGAPSTAFTLPSEVLAGVEAIELGDSAVATASGALRIWVSATASPHALAIYGTGSAAYEITGATSHADTITGGSGNDTLNAGAGDSMDGADGSDRYVFTRKAHLNGSVIDDSGATGTDTVLIDLDYYLDPPADGPIVVDQQLGGIEKIQVNADLATTQIFEFDFSSQDQGYTFSSNANVVGDPAKRTGRIEIYGTEHGDRFEAGTQGHRYVGGAGDDTFAGANAGSRYEGGDGEDVVWLDATYAIPGTWSGIESVLLGNASTGATDGTAAINLRAGGSAQALAITGNNGVNAITGTNFDDSISGNGGSDVISAGGGNDTIEGGAGADQMLGGAGDDVFLGLGGGDRINGNIGTDTLMLAGAGEALDLTALFNTALRSVETIDITGSGANSLKLDFDDVKYNLGAGGTLHVVADADDDVALAGDWTNLGSEGTVTSYSATSRGQTVFVEVDQAAAAGLTIFAVDGPDSISGGTGNDTVVFEDGTFDFSDDFADAGDGTDTLVVDGTLVNMFEGTFVSFEKVEVRDGANLFVNNETLEISATSGDNTTRLGNNAAQTYLGNDGADTVHLGAAGQSVDTGMGDDILRSTPARLVGSTLTAGEGFDTLMIEGNGAADLGELAGSLADLERIEVVSVGISSLTLSDEGFDVVLQHPLTVESGDGDDKFIFLSTNLFQSATVTLNNFTAGGDDDIIQLLLTDLGAYVGEVGAAGVDAALAGSAGLKDVVFDTDNSRLIVDINMDDAYGAGDLTIQLTGVTDLTVGLDLLMGA